MSTDDKRIREFAYQIWESEGKPEGHEARHWEMARKLAEAEALAPKKAPKAAGSKTAGKGTDSKAPAARPRRQPPPRPNRQAPPKSSRRVKSRREKAPRPTQAPAN